jgi:hypothetical protein
VTPAGLRSFSPPFWRFLAEVAGGKVMRAMVREARQWDADAFDIAEAVYWLAYGYGESEFCPLRRAATASRYRPGRCDSGPESDAARAIYDAMQCAIRRDGCKCAEPVADVLWPEWDGTCRRCGEECGHRVL